MYGFLSFLLSPPPSPPLPPPHLSFLPPSLLCWEEPRARLIFILKADISVLILKNPSLYDLRAVANRLLNWVLYHWLLGPWSHFSQMNFSNSIIVMFYYHKMNGTGPEKSLFYYRDCQIDVKQSSLMWSLSSTLYL